MKIFINMGNKYQGVFKRNIRKYIKLYGHYDT